MKLQKRLLCILLAFCMAAATLPATALAADTVASGTCGDNLTWVLDSDGTLTISGTGDMENYTSSAPWYSYRSSIRSAIIGPGVTSIESYAFDDCFNLSSITIPDNVTSIGSGAFEYCSSLSSVTIPDSVTSIGAGAFEYCSSLSSIDVDANNPQYASIDGVLFNKNLTALIQYPIGKDETSYAIPDSVTSIESSAFSDCTSLSSVTIPDGVTSIESSAFYDCASLSSVTIPDSVTSIGVWAFKYCTSLSSVTIPDSVTSIGSETFYDCTSLSSITIPDSVTSIGECAFYYCTSLTDVYYSGSEADWAAISIADGNTYLTNATIHYNYTDLGDIETSPGDEVTVCPGFHFSTNAVTSCVETGAIFELYVGYYLENGSLDVNSKEFVSVVSNDNVIAVTPDGWDDTYGQRYTIRAKDVGSSMITVTNPKNNDAASLQFYVIEKENGYSFDNVPKLTYEEGKTTNFYNYNGMVVDEFTYTPHENENGEVDYYVVTMTVYNSLDLYGAVTAFDAEGNLKSYRIIDKKTTVPTSFVATVKDLWLQTGDLFYLINNSSYYSGKSITKETKVSIEVPVGGYLEISNSPSSVVAVLANTIGLLVDGVSATYKVTDVIETKPLIIDDIIFKYAISNDSTVGKKLFSTIKTAAIDEFKHGNWNYDNYGECLQEFLNQLEESGVNIIESVAEKMVSLEGMASITESVVRKVIPTGPVIDFLFGVLGIEEEAAAWVTFSKSADFSNGIYIYAPATGNSYESNGVSVIPATTTDSNVVIHAYLVIDSNEVEITSATFPNEKTYWTNSYETYSITMYKDGQEIQPNSTVTVRIPLSDTFKSLDTAQIKVYRINDDGTASDMSASVIDGYAVFMTDHFSYYAVAYEGEIAASGVSLQKSNITITQVGKTETLTATVTPDNATNKVVTWSSSNPAVATVNSNGVVTAVSNGTAIITVTTVDGGYTANCLVTVKGSSNGGGISIGGTTTVPGNMNTDDTNTGNPNTSIPNAPLPFTDVTQNNWFYEAVQYVYQNGLMNGISAAAFAPGNTTSRGMIVTILYRLEGEPAAGTSAFTDVAPGQWYTDAVAWASANGIVLGTSATTFNPNDPITRQDMAVILYRYAKYKGYDTTLSADLNKYTDAENISDYAVDAMKWANDAGLITGTDTGLLNPIGSTTRAEAAAIFMRFCENIKK